MSKSELHDWECEIEALEQEPCEDIMTIHTQGLDEGIRCAMCTNSMKSDRGCDGGCMINEAIYEEVMNTIRNHIVPPVTPTTRWIPVSERLPGEGITVIGTTKFDDIYKTEYYDDCGKKKWYADGDFDIPIVAWMPLPERYEAEKENE